MPVLSYASSANVTISAPGAYVTVICANGESMAVSWVSPSAISGQTTVTSVTRDVGPFADGTVVTLTATAGSPSYIEVNGAQYGFMKLASTSVGGAGMSKTDSDTSVGVLWTVAIPAGTLLANDSLIIRPKVTVPNSATTKTFGVRTATGAISLYAVSATTSASILPWIDMQMRNSLTSQIIVPNGTTGISSVSGTAFLTTNIDFSIDQTLQFYAQWGTAGAGSNSITLEACDVYRMRG